MSNQPLISIIIPAYNIVDYIEKCIVSVTNQTYENIEILLIDDGSNDGTEVICDNLGKRDRRIRVIHKENRGLSDARNVGLDIAEGDFITFIDGDDYIIAEYCEYLHELIEKYDADISMCDYIEVVDKKMKVQIKNYQKEKVYEKEKGIEELLYQKLTTSSVCAKLYRKKIFAHIRFPVGKIHEDVATVYKTFTEAQRVAYKKRYIYYYLKRKDSIVNSSFGISKMDYLEHTTEMMHFIAANFPRLRNASISRHFSACVQVLNMIDDREKYKVQYFFIKREVDQYKKCVLMNSKARVKNRITALVAIIDFNLLYKLLKIIYSHK